ncbi:Imm52 family immunity protein [Luteimonas sp. RD2P54]|uniref:Imm52 family immunity protein n=1 Tax=Luteimonas endophytica TaxID=3042023 RepID=A0ABT6J530_9GAMM|nr:Imm52 family immunity protein [Luteimonas endophytica]MDH5821910.1 Imm52 family immunity protein [Luteimonas endophytica]
MILNSQINLRAEPVGKTSEQVLQLATDIVTDLAPLHRLMANWHSMPASPKDSPAPLSDRDTVLARMESEIEKNRKLYGDFDELGASLTISNVDNNRDWRSPGVVVLGLNPMTGFFSLQLKGIEPFGGAAPDVMRDSLNVLVRRIGPKFANTDVKSRTRDKGLVAYQFNRRLYRHREFFGWMGFVPAELPHDRIRDAAAVYPVPGHGTVIVSVPGLFDPADDAQVDKAHRVEMDLASYDLLPVLDPNLKE